MLRIHAYIKPFVYTSTDKHFKMVMLATYLAVCVNGHRMFSGFSDIVLAIVIFYTDLYDDIIDEVI